MSKLNDLAIKTLSKLAASPRLKALLWRRWYEDLAGKYSQNDWTFMNYGFWDEEIENLPLAGADTGHRPSIGLYERVTRGVNLADKKVLEIGSGRGGGASYLARTRDPRLMVGIDYSHQAVKLAQKLHDAHHLRFRQGDALNLPLQTESFDVVLNVESSHCYVSMPDFLDEAARVLKTGGTFAWCDMRPQEDWVPLRLEFSAAGLEIQEETDITASVLQALDIIAPARQEVITHRVPPWLYDSFADFAGMPGSKVYNLLKNGEYRYGVIRAVRF